MAAAVFFTSQHSSVSWVKACDGTDDERAMVKDGGEGEGLFPFRTLRDSTMI